MFMSPARNQFAAESENSERDASTWARCFNLPWEAAKLLFKAENVRLARLQHR